MNCELCIILFPLHSFYISTYILNISVFLFGGMNPQKAKKKR
jgi:hypothetical protein